MVEEQHFAKVPLVERLATSPGLTSGQLGPFAGSNGPGGVGVWRTSKLTEVGTVGMA